MTATPHHAPSTPPGRMFLILGFLGTTAVTSVAGYLTTGWLAERAAVQSERISKKNAFEQAIMEMNPLLKRLNEDAIAGRSLESAKTSIENNLVVQIGQVSVSAPLLDVEGQEAAERYRSSLAAYSDALEEFDGPGRSGSYQQAVGNLLTDQEALLAAMRRSSGLKS